MVSVGFETRTEIDRITFDEVPSLGREGRSNGIGRLAATLLATIGRGRACCPEGNLKNVPACLSASFEPPAAGLSLAMAFESQIES